MMVNDDDIGRLRLAPRLDDKTVIDTLAPHPEAIVDRRANPRLEAVAVGQIMVLR